MTRLYCRKWLIAFVCLCMILAAQTAHAQSPSRAEAIARIAELYPHSHKSPEQIYDEGQIQKVAQTFARRFGSRALDALTGPLPEDTVRQIEVPVERPLVTTPTHRDSAQMAERAASSDTTDVAPEMPPVETRTITIQRRSVFNTGHALTTTAEQDYTEAERRALRRNMLDMLGQLPSDVRIVLRPGNIAYRGQTATVETQWVYDVVGTPTRISRPYQDRPGGTVMLQMRRVGDEWLVADFRGLIDHLKTTVASR